ncbi:hypothetical protein IWW50_007106, partial [Coemansia erecta]
MEHTSVSQRYSAAASQSPVPSLTTGTSRASSASSSCVNSLSPDTLATTPRDLLPRFEAAGHGAELFDCKKQMAGQHGQEVVESTKQSGSVAAPELLDSTAQNEATRKRRRESATELTDTPLQCRKRAMQHAPARRRQATGSTDFVSKYGLTDLYNQFVRPYAGEARQPLPDLASAYLGDVAGAQAAAASLDLVGLVLAPPKNDFERLDLLPMASIKAAFRIGAAPHAGEAKRSRVSLKTSDGRSDAHKRQKSGATPLPSK